MMVDRTWLTIAPRGLDMDCQADLNAVSAMVAELCPHTVEPERCMRVGGPSTVACAGCAPRVARGIRVSDVGGG